MPYYHQHVSTTTLKSTRQKFISAYVIMKPVGRFPVKLEALDHDGHPEDVLLDLFLAFLAGGAITLRVFRLEWKISLVRHV